VGHINEFSKEYVSNAQSVHNTSAITANTKQIPNVHIDVNAPIIPGYRSNSVEYETPKDVQDYLKSQIREREESRLQR
jgi:hypothetical protein